MNDEPTVSERDEMRESNRKVRQRAKWRRTRILLYWMLGPLVFLTLLVFTGKLGVSMAEAALPESARQSLGYPVGAVVIAGRDGNPVYFAEKIQDLRDFYYKYPTPEKRREGTDVEKFGIRRIFVRVELETLKSDADAVKVQVRSGPLADTMYWIHVSQLPDAKTL